jgi:uncharacterized protein
MHPRRGTMNGPAIPETIHRVGSAAQTFFEGSRGSHGWDHTLRVYHLCERMGPEEAADMEVLRIAALLHDIARGRQDESRGRLCHAEEGAEMARPMLTSLDLEESRKENILHCIRAHRFRGDRTPRSLEAEILFDADKLDAIGAVGVARAYLFAGEIGACLHNPEIDVEHSPAYSRNDTGYREFKVKLSRIKDRMLTETGRRMARERHAFMEAFFARFLAECAGAK